MIPWSTLITGVVGLAGIGGTIASARVAGNAAIKSVRLNIAAGEYRDREAVKRSAYAQCQASFERMIRAIQDYRISLIDQQDDRLINDSQEIMASELDMRVALSGLKLVGPKSVRDLADEAARYLEDFISKCKRRAPLAVEEDPQDEFLPRRHLLYEAMRADLGEASDEMGRMAGQPRQK